MINSFSVKNFKSLNMDPVILYPLTILSGINNSGKTTFIQAILELAKYREGIYHSAQIPIMSNYITKVLDHKSTKKIEFFLSLKTFEESTIELNVKYKYDKKIKGGFPCFYSIFSRTNESKIESKLLLKKKDINEPFEIDAIKSLSLIHGRIKKHKEPPLHFRGNGDFAFVGNIPYYAQISFESNPTMNSWLDQEEDDSIRVAIPFSTLLVDSLTDIKYIGPLRGHPEEFYFFETRGSDIADSGENTIEVLDRLKNKNIQFYQKIDDDKVVKMTLLCALQFWTKFFFGEDVTIELKTIAENLVQVLINGHTINHSGFGFSQLLPIIVQALLLKKNQLLLLEQPEIHLHPDLELKLAYFLLCITKNERQIIAETHSEHIINQLVLSKMKQEITDEQFKIYFLNKDSQSGTTHFNPIDISSRGVIKNWPIGFFDQYLNFSKELVRLRKELAMKDS